jgi:hypothetical protein
LVYDTMSVSLIALAGAITVDRRILWLLVVSVPGLFVAAWRPELSQAVFPAVAIVAVIGLVSWHRTGRRAAQ